MEVIRLSELAGILQKGIREQFGNRLWWVTGEVSGLKFYPNKGHLYFHLVEKNAQTGLIAAEFSCVGFSEAYANVKQFESITGSALADGMEVLMAMEVDYQPARGLKLFLKKIDPNYSLGLIQQQRQLTIQKLLLENPDAVQWQQDRLLTRNQRLSLPLAFQRIAIVSSEQSAGFQDFTHTLENNPFGYQIQIDVYPTLVQGEANVKHMVARLIEIHTSAIPYDAVVIVRGGGSQTDFMLYDAYQLVRAVARFPIPVIVGLGHLKDISLVDLVAHTSLKTPTKVAEFILEQNRKFEESMLGFRQRMVIQVQKTLLEQQTRLSAMNDHLRQRSRERCQLDEVILQKLQQASHRGALQAIHVAQQIQATLQQRLIYLPGLQISQQAHLIGRLYTSLSQQASNTLRFQKSTIDHFENLLRLLGPEATIRRGFAMIKKQGKPIAHIDALQLGDSVELYLPGGSAEASIQTIKHHGKTKR